MENGNAAYASLLEAFGAEGARRARDGALRMFLGVVKKVSPLEIDVGGTVQRAADGKLWCNPALLPDYLRSASIAAPVGSIAASVNCVVGAISRLTANGSGALTTKALRLTDAGFAAGDRLVLLTQDQQTFYILCREVRL